MKSLILCSTFLAALLPVLAQEQLPRAEAMKYACLLSLDLKQMLDTPIPTDPDIKRPIALRGGGRGAMLLPESKLTAEILAKAGKEVISIGQLWLVKVAPMDEGKVVPVDKLKGVEVRAEDQKATAFCCALATRKNSAGGLDLLVFGKGKEPILRTPLKDATSQNSIESPLDMSAERTDAGAEVTLKVLGKYQAKFMVGEAEP